MPSKNDISREATDQELLLVDLLYGELDGDQATKVRAGLGESDAAELASFEGLRDLLREIPDEEPPPAISARLVHLAAVSAQAPATASSARSARSAAAAAAGGGFLARLFDLFRPLLASPAMATATMFVLVAGVAGALYVTGNFETTESTISSNQLAPATDQAAARLEAAPAAKREAGRAATLAPSPLEKEAADLGLDDLDGIEEVVAPAENKPTAPAGTLSPADSTFETTVTRGDRLSRKTKKKTAYPSRPKASSRAPRKNAPTKTNGSIQGRVGDSPLVDVNDVNDEEDADRSRGSGEPVGKSGVSGDSDGAKDDGKADAESAAEGEDKQAEQAESKASQLRVRLADLHRRAAQAASDGECRAVLSLGERIRKLDADYYRSTYRRDKRLARCLAAKSPNSRR